MKAPDKSPQAMLGELNMARHIASLAKQERYSDADIEAMSERHMGRKCCKADIDQVCAELEQDMERCCKDWEAYNREKKAEQRRQEQAAREAAAAKAREDAEA